MSAAHVERPVVPEHDQRRGLLSRAWLFLRRPNPRLAAGLLLSIGFAVGMIGWISFTRVVEVTNSLAFCTSCHAMQAFVYPEYQASHHFSNASGVRAICSDCHVPSAFFPKMGAKLRATYVEVPAWLTGRIATQEKFDARKEYLAERVWARMRATDSRECRDCHTWQAMSSEAQAPRAWREHQAGRQSGETCVDCHKGVAHELPSSMLEPAEFDFGDF
jgi:nitrate/TMAO reductase-like tetraheme cytochrome c subunit